MNTLILNGEVWVRKESITPTKPKDNRAKMRERVMADLIRSNKKRLSK